MTRVATLLMISMFAAAAVAQVPQRDRPRTRPSGTSSIVGAVVSDETEPRPLRRAHVTLRGSAFPDGDLVITRDDGTFEFQRLPAGRYSIAAAKSAYVSMSYGARRPAQPGVSLAVESGETKRIVIRLPRGAAITGVLTDAEGQPAPGLFVSAFTYRYSAAAGERRLLPAVAAFSVTDENGAYRIFGLAAGEYFIGTQMRQMTGVLATVTTSDVRMALAEVRSTTTGDRRIPSTLTPSQPSASKAEVTLVPVYYPGTATITQATLVKVASGDERTGIDFQVVPVAAATVSGNLPLTTPLPTVTLTRQDGLPATEPGSRRATSLDPFGRFSFRGIAPGRYTVSATVRPDLTPAKGGQFQWATSDLTVDGQDVTVALSLQPALTVSGRVVFDGDAPPLSSMRLPLPISSATSGAPGPQVDLEPDGRFTISRIIAGPYRLLLTPGIRTRIGSWWLKSIAIGGRELLDSPLDLQKEVNDAVVTFSSRATELSGVVSSATPGEQPDAFVIVFTTDRNAWFHNSRRVAGVRPDAEGRYAISNLPPGDYFAVVDDNVDPNEWFDPAVLDRLVPRAVRITLGANETRTHDFVNK